MVVEAGVNDENLNRLESILRFWGKNRSFFHLEAIDENLLEELRGSFNDYLEHEGEELVITPDTRSGINPLSRVENELKPAESNRSAPVITQKSLPFEEAGSLVSLGMRIRDCDRCKLCMTRKTIVVGQGNPNADLLFVGEGPGEDEDKTGLAFVGRAGQLLTQIIQSIGLNRDSVFIGNVIKCRPPGNRDPERNEIEQCSPILFKQIELLKPKLIVTLGNVATKTIIPEAPGIMKIRGSINYFGKIPVIPTFHPSYLLRNPNAVGPVWDDMRLVRQKLFLKG
ncbi:MAG: uracil-DNA glycosylase [Proteobacteria bacterium]|nr:uracil-DNA glycosylase [Pseudomonadota bacterium]